MKKTIISVLSIILISPALCHAQGKNVVKAFKGALNAAKGGAKTSLFSGAGVESAINSMRTDGQMLFESANRAAEIKAAAKAEADNAIFSDMRNAVMKKYDLDIPSAPGIPVIALDELYRFAAFNIDYTVFTSTGTAPKIFGKAGAKKTGIVMPQKQLKAQLGYYNDLINYSGTREVNGVMVTTEYKLDFDAIIELPDGNFAVLRELPANPDTKIKGAASPIYDDIVEYIAELRKSNPPFTTHLDIEVVIKEKDGKYFAHYKYNYNKAIEFLKNK